MSADKNNSDEDLESQQSRDLTELKRQIQLSNLQLLDLTHNEQKFLQHIHDLNAKGVQCIENEEHKQAVIYFSECQKILEYAASCGKTIDRSIIVVTLHNQACVNQKLWDLQKSANYLEAIIYNINVYFESLKNSQKYKEQLQQYCAFIHKKLLFGLYHLQFCAVNSQIRKHSISLSSAKSAIHIIREVCHELFELSQKVLYEDLTEINHAKVNSCTLKDLAHSTEDLALNDYQKYFAIIKELIGQKQRNKSSNEDQFKNIRNFSIGKLMQLTPVTLSDMQSKQSPKDWIKSENIITLSLYLGVCYFTVGTELRFISSQNSQEGNEVYKLSQDFLISQVYHIYAIMMVLKHVPVRSIFLNHLLTSFNSHYDIDLEKVFLTLPSIKNSKKMDKKETESYSSSQQLHIGASTLPQESAIKTQPNYRFDSQNLQKMKLQQLELQKELQLLNFQVDNSRERNSKNQNQLSNREKHSDVNLTARSKLPGQQLPKSKMKKNTSKSKRKNDTCREDNFKSETLIHINRHQQPSKYQNSIKITTSKTKSDFHRNSLSKKKKQQQKLCIYTTKLRRDMNMQKSNNEKTVSKKKSKSKKSSKQVKPINKTIHSDSKKKLMRNQKSKSKSKSSGREKQKEKEKKSSRNIIGKLEKKYMQQARTISKQADSKSKPKFRREKFKMNRVEGIKH